MVKLHWKILYLFWKTFIFGSLSLNAYVLGKVGFIKVIRVGVEKFIHHQLFIIINIEILYKFFFAHFTAFFSIDHLKDMFNVILTRFYMAIGHIIPYHCDTAYHPFYILDRYKALLVLVQNLKSDLSFYFWWTT
jgi:hypothetical protein